MSILVNVSLAFSPSGIDDDRIFASDTFFKANPTALIHWAIVNPIKLFMKNMDIMHKQLNMFPSIAPYFFPTLVTINVAGSCNATVNIAYSDDDSIICAFVNPFTCEKNITLIP